MFVIDFRVAVTTVKPDDVQIISRYRNTRPGRRSGGFGEPGRTVPCGASISRAKIVDFPFTVRERHRPFEFLQHDIQYIDVFAISWSRWGLRLPTLRLV